MKLTLVLLMALVAVCMASGGPFNSSYINSLIEAGAETYGNGKHMFNSCGGKNKADKWVGIPITPSGNTVIRFPNRGNTVNLQFTFAASQTDTADGDTYGSSDGWDVFAHYTIFIQSVSFYSYDESNKIHGSRAHVNLNNFAWDWDGCAFTPSGTGYSVTLDGYRYNLHSVVTIVMDPIAGTVVFTTSLTQAAPAESSGKSDNEHSEKINVVEMAKNANTAALNFKLGCSMGEDNLAAVDTNYDTENNGNCPLIYGTGANFAFNDIDLKPSKYIKTDVAADVVGLDGKLDVKFTITGSTGSINGFTKNPIFTTSSTYHNPYGSLSGTGGYRLRRNYDDEDVFATDDLWDSDDWSPRYALEIIYPAGDVSAATDTITIVWDPTACLDGECKIREANPDALPEAQPEPEPEAKPEAQPEAKPEPEAQPEPEPEVVFEIPTAIEENSSTIVRATLALVALAAVALF